MYLEYKMIMVLLLVYEWVKGRKKYNKDWEKEPKNEVFWVQLIERQKN